MSIQSEIELLQNTKNELRTAIMEKGVTVYADDLYSTYPTRISQISMTQGDKDNLFRDIIERDITSITIPDGTTTIKKYCFYHCENLESVFFPESLSTISESAFRYCVSLASVTIPSSVTRIWDWAFDHCSGLTSITINATTPPTLTGDLKNAFDNTNNCPIYVPENCVDAYKTAWPDYASRIQAIPEVKFFRRITNINDVTSGKYLIVDTANNVALNASLIANTMSTSDGINDIDNYISVEITGDTIEATERALNAAVDYDGSSYLTWTDENTGTVYYLSPNRSTKSSTFKPNATSPSGAITLYENYNGDITFKASAKAIALLTNTSGSKFRWQATASQSNFNNVALFKLM